MVINPVTINPGATLADAMLLMQQHRISGIPVVEPGSEKLVSILTNRDVRFARDQRQTVAELMTHESLITVTEGCERDEAGACSTSTGSKSCWSSTTPSAASA